MKKNARPDKSRYKKRLRELQIDLVTFQRHLLKHGQKVSILFEGRDAAGKDGTIKRFTEHLSPRDTRVVPLGPPSDRDRSAWYFQRDVTWLPAAGEMVFFNRSWCNRVGVERVMGFCTDEEYRAYLHSVRRFEVLLLESGIQLFKFCLDISEYEQVKRLEARKTDPLKQWKSSPIDDTAVALWDKYSAARDEMLAKTNSTEAPWIVVRANDKKRARLNVMRYFLSPVWCPEQWRHQAVPDPEIINRYEDVEWRQYAL